MILCLDIGNSHIFGGVFDGDDIKLRFRYASDRVTTSDQIGVFFRDVLRENQIDPARIQSIVSCSVVPQLDYSVTAACIKYFNIEPFVLRPGVKTGLKLHVKNPLEIGADRIANAMAALQQFPNKGIIVLDFGTATTLCVITADKTYHGGVIMPGFKISMQALHTSAARLHPVEIVKPPQTLGKATEDNIQSGLYYGQLGATKEMIQNLTQEVFEGEKPIIVATGGFAHLFEDENLFTINNPDLVLHGLKIALEKNG